MKRPRFSALLSLTVLLFAGRVSAQSIPSPYRFIDQRQAGGFYTGYFLTSEGALGLAPKSAPIFGGRYTIRLGGPFVIEAELGYLNTTRAVLDTVVVLPDSTRARVGTADFSAVLASGGLRFNFTGPRTWHGLQPFLAFGGGAIASLTGAQPDDQKVAADARFNFGTHFAGHFGGGIEWFPSRRFSTRIDARNVIYKVNTPSGFLLGTVGDRTPGDEWLQNGLLTAGFWLHV